MNQTLSLQLRRAIALLSLFFVIPQSFSIKGEYYNADSLYLIYGAGILVSLCIYVFLAIKNKKAQFVKEDLPKPDQWMVFVIACVLPGALVTTFLPIVNHQPTEVGFPPHAPQYRTQNFEEKCSFGFCRLSIRNESGEMNSYIGYKRLELGEACIGYDSGVGELGISYLSYVISCGQAENYRRSRIARGR